MATRVALTAIVPLFCLATPLVAGGGHPAPDPVRAAIVTRLSGTRPAPLSAQTWRQVRWLYRDAGDSALWLDGSRLRRRAESLVYALANAHTEGLRLSAYPLTALRNALVPLRGPSPTNAQLAEADVLLTSAFVAFGENRLAGQVEPTSMSQSWHIAPREAGVDSALASARRAPSFDSALASLRPYYDNYLLLARELARYRGIVAAGGWAKQPAGGVLAPGDTTTGERLTALARRLRAEGYSAGEVPALRSDGNSPSRAIYDTALARTVATYQQRHGLVADGILGPATRAALDVSAEFRLQQIAANLERLRWLPRTLGDRYVLVNVPTFSLLAYDADTLAFTMKVIVGTEYRNRATPTFSDSVSYVVFRPYWNVPQSIATNEIWPKARRDPGYLARNDYEVVRAGGSTRIRQKPGAQNSLGLVKFIFPNDFSIYLHDTPARELFDQHLRAFSHGCIRVERPEELAEFMLGSQGWDRNRIEQAMLRGRNDQRVDLVRKLPVYIVYFTTYVRDGTLYFGPDVYDRDARLVRAVARAAMPTDTDLAAADEVRALVTQLVGP